MSIGEYCCFILSIGLEGDGWVTSYGSGYVLGKACTWKEEFIGTAEGMEAIMRIMNVVGVTRLNDLNGKYVRVVTAEWGGIIDKIGNIIEDKWFSWKDFFKEKGRKLI